MVPLSLSLSLSLVFPSGGLGGRSLWIKGVLIVWVLSLDIRCDVRPTTDNAIYPSLFLKYFASYIHSENFFNTDLVRFTFTVGLTIILSVINYSGLHIVGNLSIVISIISMSPFVIMVFLSIPKIDPSRWTVMPIPEVETDDDGVGFIPTPLFSGVHWRLEAIVE